MATRKSSAGTKSSGTKKIPREREEFSDEEEPREKDTG